MDVNGNDNQPEWGWCNATDCTNAASPIWLSGDYPDDPDLLLCDRHIGAEIARLRAGMAALRYALDGTTRLLEDRSNNTSRAWRWARAVVAANEQVLAAWKEP